MTARTASLIGSLTFAAVVAACSGFYEIPIETPIQAKLDVSSFQRVLVAGFVAGGTDDVDANQETIRLLRSQLRSKSSLKVIEADALPLMSLVSEAHHSPNGGSLPPLPQLPAGDGQEQPTATPPAQQPPVQAQPAPEKPAEAKEPKIKNEKDLEDVSSAVRDALSFRFVSEMETVLEIVFGDALVERARILREAPAAAEPELRSPSEDEFLGDAEPAGAATPVETEG